MLGIETRFSEFAKFCGLKEAGERGYSAFDETMKSVEYDTKGARPLSDSLLYKYSDDETGVVFSEDSIGCWFEIDPIVGSNDSIEKNMTLFFGDELPGGVYLQFLLVASHEISHILDLWESGRKDGGDELKV